MEAFDDGAIAIIIVSIMVLEIKVPRGDGLVTQGPLIPVFISEVLGLFYGLLPDRCIEAAHRQ